MRCQLGRGHITHDQRSAIKAPGDTARGQDAPLAEGRFARPCHWLCQCFRALRRTTMERQGTRDTGKASATRRLMPSALLPPLVRWIAWTRPPISWDRGPNRRPAEELRTPRRAACHGRGRGGRHRAGPATSWSRPAPAWARASPTWCPPSWPPSPPPDKKSRRRIVISTHTISLQEQLIQKDLPLLRSVMPVEFSAVLVKGRRNYVSLRRLDNALARAASLFSEDEEFDELRQIAAWAKHSGDGSLSDLDFRPHPAVWDEVASDHGNCMGRVVSALQGLLLLPGPAAGQPCPNPGRQPCPVLHRPGPAAGRRQHPAQVRRGDLRRSPHARGRRRRSPRAVDQQRRRSSSPCGGSTTSGPTAGCWCITACARRRNWPGSAASGPTASSPTSPPGSRSSKRGNGRVRQPKIVENALSEGLAALAVLHPPRRQEDREGRRAPGPAGRRRPARRPGRRDRAMALPAARGGRLLDRGTAGPPAAADRVARPRRWTSGQSSARNSSTRSPA